MASKTVGSILIDIVAGTVGFEKGMKQLDRRMKSVSRNFQRIGSSLTRSITLPLAAVGGASVKAFAGFDDAMTKSMAIMGNLSNEMKSKMSDTAREVARTTTISAKEAAEGYYFLASAGLTAAQSVQALGQTAKFAQAGAFDMARATDLLTDAQSALGLTVKDAGQNLENMARISDVLVKANTVANASVEQFSEALTNKAAAAARLVGMEVEETVAVLAAFADQGIKGADAGTAFNIVLRDLQTKALQNKEAFKKLGIAVFDQNNEFRKMADVVADLENALKNTSDAKKKELLLTLGLTDKSIAFTQVLLGTSKAMRQYGEDTKAAGGITDEVEQKQLKSFTAQMTLLWHRVQDVGIVIGEKLAPVVLQLSTYLTTLVEKFKGLDAQTQSFVLTFGGLAGTIGPVLLLLGKLVAIIGGVLLGKVILVTAAIAALAAAFVSLGDDSGSAFMKLSETVSILMETLRQQFPLTSKVIGAFADFVKMKLDELVRSIESFFGLIGDTIDFFKKNSQALAVIPGMGALMMEMDQYSAKLEEVKRKHGEVKASQQQATETFNSIKNVVQETTKSLYENAKAWVVDTAEQVKNKVAQEESQKALVQNKEKIEDWVTSVKKGQLSLTEFNILLDSLTKLSDKSKHKFKEQAANLVTVSKEMKTATDKAKKLREEYEKTVEELETDIKLASLKEALDESLKGASQAEYESALQNYQNALRSVHVKAAQEKFNIDKGEAEKIADLELASMKDVNKERAEHLKKTQMEAHEDSVDFWREAMGVATGDISIDWKDQMKKTGMEIAANFLANFTSGKGGGVMGALSAAVSKVFGTDGGQGMSGMSSILQSVGQLFAGSGGSAGGGSGGGGGLWGMIGSLVSSIFSGEGDKGTGATGGGGGGQDWGEMASTVGTAWEGISAAATYLTGSEVSLSTIGASVAEWAGLTAAAAETAVAGAGATITSAAAAETAGVAYGTAAAGTGGTAGATAGGTTLAFSGTAGGGAAGGTAVGGGAAGGSGAGAGAAAAWPLAVIAGAYMTSQRHEALNPKFEAGTATREDYSSLAKPLNFALGEMIDKWTDSSFSDTVVGKLALDTKETLYEKWGDMMGSATKDMPILGELFQQEWFQVMNMTLLSGGDFDAWGGWAGESLDLNFASGKDPRQRSRDAFRDVLEQTGLGAEAEFTTATTGEAYSFQKGDYRLPVAGEEGGELAGEAIPIGMAIAQSFGASGQIAEDAAGLLTGGLLEGAEDFNEVLMNTSALLEGMGVSTEQVKEGLTDAFLDGKISLEEFGSGVSTVNMMAREDLIGEGSILDAFNIVSKNLGEDGNLRAGLKGLEFAFREAAEVGEDQFQTVSDFIAQNFGPEAAAEFQKMKDIGVSSFEDFANLSSDQIFAIFNILDGFSEKMAEATGNLDTLTEKANNLPDIDVSAGGGGTTESAQGMAFFAKGGIVNQPTAFQFAAGGAMRNGLMGEAGPEAILPLTRINGDLGVKSVGGGDGGNIYLSIDARGASPGVENRIIAALKTTENNAVKRAVNAVRTSQSRGF